MIWGKTYVQSSNHCQEIRVFSFRLGQRFSFNTTKYNFIHFVNCHLPIVICFQCCCALALINFLAGSELNDIIEPMQSLETIFSGSYLKGIVTLSSVNHLKWALLKITAIAGNGVVPNITPDEASLHASALSSWNLLLTLLSPYDVYKLMSSNEEHCCLLPWVIIN